MVAVGALNGDEPVAKSLSLSARNGNSRATHVGILGHQSLPLAPMSQTHSVHSQMTQPMLAGRILMDAQALSILIIALQFRRDI